MSAHNNHLRQAGFTLVELLITVVLIGIIGSTFVVAFKSSLFGYLNLQATASTFTNLQQQANRVANVLRSTTGITAASATSFTGYVYFYPSDTYVSQIHYFQQTTGGLTQVIAEVTPMTANPPTGTLITAQERTYTVIDNYYQTSSTDLFTYLNAGGAAMSYPITDTSVIKGIKVSLAARATATSNGNQIINVQVALRNRKTNL